MNKKEDNLSSLDDKAFNFINVPNRSKKPRNNGITCVHEMDMGIREVEDMLEFGSDYIDWVKFGSAAHRLLTSNFLRKKIRLYNEHDVNVYFAGDVIERSIINGVFDECLKEIKTLGGQGLEISTCNINISNDDIVSHIKLANEYDLRVITEIGRKGEYMFEKIGKEETILPIQWYNHPNYIIKQISQFLDAGSWKVVIQGEGLSENVKIIKEDVYYKIATECDLERIIFQAKFSKMFKWLIYSFGKEVNLDINHGSLIQLELVRRGFSIPRGQTFGMLG